MNSFFEALGALSRSQLEFLGEMIPDRVAPLFDGDFDCHLGIKILGAGGGGYMLAFTDDSPKAEEQLAGFDIKWV